MRELAIIVATCVSQPHDDVIGDPTPPGSRGGVKGPWKLTILPCLKGKTVYRCRSAVTAGLATGCDERRSTKRVLYGPGDGVALPAGKTPAPESGTAGEPGEAWTGVAAGEDPGED